MVARLLGLTLTAGLAGIVLYEYRFSTPEHGPAAVAPVATEKAEKKPPKEPNTGSLAPVRITTVGRSDFPVDLSA